MSLEPLIVPAGALFGVRAASKKQLFAAVAERLAPAAGVEGERVATALADRERLGTTGFGGGTAIPHGRLPGLERPLGCIVRLDSPIDWGALDGAPVDLVFALLTSENHGAEHLKTLALVSRAFRDRALVAKLRGAGSADAMLAIIGEAPQTRAA